MCPKLRYTAVHRIAPLPIGMISTCCPQYCHYHCSELPASTIAYLKTDPGDMFWQCFICVVAVSKCDRPRVEEERRQLAALSTTIQFVSKTPRESCDRVRSRTCRSCYIRPYDCACMAVQASVEVVPREMPFETVYGLRRVRKQRQWSESSDSGCDSEAVAARPKALSRGIMKTVSKLCADSLA